MLAGLGIGLALLVCPQMALADEVNPVLQVSESSDNGDSSEPIGIMATASNPVESGYVDGKIVEGDAAQTAVVESDDDNEGEDPIEPGDVVLEDGADSEISDEEVSDEVEEPAAPQAISIATAQVSLAQTVFVSTGKAHNPKPTVVLDGRSLKLNTDYKVSYRNNVNPGTAEAVIQGIGQYTEKIVIPFTIKKNIKTATAEPVQAWIYTGQPRKPKPVVKDGSKTLTRKVDYKVAERINNINAGTGKIRIVGIGEYGGEKYINFKIVKVSSIKLNHSIAMIDNAHYDRVRLVAKVSPNVHIGSHDITWTIHFKNPYKNAASFNRKKMVAKKQNDETVWVFGRKWSGDKAIKVTASLPNGLKASCLLKVISSSADNDTYLRKTKWQGTTFYLTYPGTGQYEDKTGNRKPISKPTKSWGDKYVAAYINNADWLVKNVKSARFVKEAAPQKIQVWKQKGLKMEWKNGTTVVTGRPHDFPITEYKNKGEKTLKTFCKSDYAKKPKGELSANDYLYIFTGKNQWEYLLKKNSKGTWKVVNSMRAAAGWNRHGAVNGTVKTNGFDPRGCLRTLTVTYYGVMSQIQACDNVPYLYGSRGVLHSEKNCYAAHGTPASMGCTHLGAYDDYIYYQTLWEAGLGTRAIVF